MSETTEPQPPEDWDRCQFYLARKHKFCPQLPGKNSLYCGHHQSSKKRKRIPCPVDPSHWILEDAVDKHVAVCPKARILREQEDLSYFCRDINASGHGELRSPSETKKIDLAAARVLAKRFIEVHNQLFGGAEDSYDGINEVLNLADLSESEISKGLSEALVSYKVKSGGKRHLHQQASLVGHLRRIDALKKTDRRIVLEVGAGRGIMGLIVAGVSAGEGTKTRLVLVERGGSRGKADKVFRNQASEAVNLSYPFDLKQVEWQRLKSDLSHVDLASISSLSSSAENEPDDPPGELVVVAKHLCGVGTDLALKACEPLRNRISACVMATCCHGVCSWPGYVGRDYLRDAIESAEVPSFGEPEFELMKRWAAVDVLEQDSSSETGCKLVVDDEHSNAVCGEKGKNFIVISSAAEGLRCGQRGLGRACQRLIDYGRREYMRHVLGVDESLNVEMLRYVEDSTTPQSTILVGRRVSKP